MKKVTDEPKMRINRDIMKLYPKDYKKDTRALKPSTRGFWMDCLCSMWRASKHGEICHTLCVYTRITSCYLEEVIEAIVEIAAHGTADFKINLKKVPKNDLVKLNLPDGCLREVLRTGLVERTHVRNVLPILLSLNPKDVRVTLICPRMRQEAKRRAKNRDRVSRHRQRQKALSNEVPLTEDDLTSR